MRKEGSLNPYIETYIILTQKKELTKDFIRCILEMVEMIPSRSKNLVFYKKIIILKHSISL